MNVVKILFLICLSQALISCGQDIGATLESTNDTLDNRFTEPLAASDETIRVNMKCGNMEFCRHQCSLNNPIGYLHQIEDAISEVRSQAAANGNLNSGATIKKVDQLYVYYKDYEDCTQAGADKIIGNDLLPVIYSESKACKTSDECVSTCFDYYKPTIDQDYLEQALTQCEPVPKGNGFSCQRYGKYSLVVDMVEACTESPLDQVMPDQAI